jgi:hypothetical protein
MECCHFADIAAKAAPTDAAADIAAKAAPTNVLAGDS